MQQGIFANDSCTQYTSEASHAKDGLFDSEFIIVTVAIKDFQLFGAGHTFSGGL
jgi:hypothetical protein